MPDYLIRPANTVAADATDLTGAVLALNVSDPGDITGLPNGTALVAQEVRLSPVSAEFTLQSFSVDVLTNPGLVNTDDLSSFTWAEGSINWGALDGTTSVMILAFSGAATNFDEVAIGGTALPTLQDTINDNPDIEVWVGPVAASGDVTFSFVSGVSNGAAMVALKYPTAATVTNLGQSRGQDDVASITVNIPAGATIIIAAVWLGNEVRATFTAGGDAVTEVIDVAMRGSSTDFNAGVAVISNATGGSTTLSVDVTGATGGRTDLLAMSIEA